VRECNKRVAGVGMGSRENLQQRRSKLVGKEKGDRERRDGWGHWERARGLQKEKHGEADPQKREGGSSVFRFRGIEPQRRAKKKKERR